MSRPICGVCEGTGKVERLSFRSPKKLIEATCSHCHGRKVVAFKVDLFDVLEWLRGLPHEEYSATGIADRIEKQFGPDDRRTTRDATEHEDMNIADVVVTHLNEPEPVELGDALYAILDRYRGQKIDAQTRAAIEAQVTDRCLRYTREHGLEPKLARVFVLQSTRDPSELLVADEKMARAAIRSGRWVDPNRRFEDDARMSDLSSVSNPKPLFDHDCSACVWLGTVAKDRPDAIPGVAADRLQAFDLYFCTQHGLPTVIGRYGNGGPDYTSGMALADVDPVLGEARARARERGLIP